MTETYFDGIQEIIEQEIGNSSSSIKVAVAWLTNEELISSILSSLDRGVTVEIILNDDEINKSSCNISHINALINRGCYILWWPQSQTLMHNKFCVIDGKCIITGSYNWTNKAENNCENILVIKDEDIAITSFQKEFAKLRKQCTIAELPPAKMFDLSKLIWHDGIYDDYYGEYFIVYDGGKKSLYDSELHLVASDLEKVFYPWLCKEGKWGHFSSSDRRLDLPIEYNFFTDRTGQPQWPICHRDDNYGLITQEGKVLLPCDYYYIQTYDEVYDVYGVGRASYFLITDRYHKKGLVKLLNDKSLTQIISCSYDSIEGRVIHGFKVKNSNGFGWLNANGETTLMCEYDKIEVLEDGKFLYVMKSGLFAVILSNGKVMIDFQENEIGYDDGVFITINHDKLNVYTLKDDEVISGQYDFDQTKPLSDSYYKQYKGKFFGFKSGLKNFIWYISKDKKEIFECDFCCGHEGYFWLLNNNCWCLVGDVERDSPVKYTWGEYELIGMFHSGYGNPHKTSCYLSLVKVAGKVSIMNHNGDILCEKFESIENVKYEVRFPKIPLNYRIVHRFPEVSFYFKRNDGKLAIFDKDSLRFTTPYKYDSIFPLGNKRYCCIANGIKYLVDGFSGQEIRELCYDEVREDGICRKGENYDIVDLQNQGDIIETDIDEYVYCYYGYTWVRKGEKWGIYEKPEISFEYDGMVRVSNSLIPDDKIIFIAKKNDNWILHYYTNQKSSFNEDTRTWTPIPYIGRNELIISDYRVIGKGFIWALIGEKWQIVDSRDGSVVGDAAYDNIILASSDHLTYCVENNNLNGLVQIQFNQERECSLHVYLDCNYQSFELFNDTDGNFKAIKIGIPSNRNNTLWGYFQPEKSIIQCRYQEMSAIWNSRNEPMALLVKFNRKYGIISCNGQIIYPLHFHSARIVENMCILIKRILFWKKEVKFNID